MALPNVFSPGQIFTAANANLLRSNQYNQTVTTKTASYTPTTTTDIGTRVIMNSASATTITINTSIYTAGDTFFIGNIGVGVCTLTAGTCTITSAGPLAIPQNGGGTLYFTSASAAIFYSSAGPTASSGLTFISSGTVSAGASISILNAFSTTYNFYSIRFSNLEMASDNVELRMQLGSSGSADTGSNYFSRGYSNGGTLSAIGATSASSFLVLPTMGTTQNGLFLELAAPFLSSATFFTSSGLGNYSGATFGSQLSGVVKTSTSYTDIFFSSNSGNAGPFTYALFGYAKS